MILTHVNTNFGEDRIMFYYELIHSEDFDPRCDVCVSHTQYVNIILGTWLQEAVLTESDWVDANMRPDLDLRHALILKSGSDKPDLERLLAWLVSNFEDTIKLASIDSIVFREQGTENVYTCNIEY